MPFCLDFSLEAIWVVCHYVRLVGISLKFAFMVTVSRRVTRTSASYLSTAMSVVGNRSSVDADTALMLILYLTHHPLQEDI